MTASLDIKVYEVWAFDHDGPRIMLGTTFERDGGYLARMTGRREDLFDVRVVELGYIKSKTLELVQAG